MHGLLSSEQPLYSDVAKVSAAVAMKWDRVPGRRYSVLMVTLPRRLCYGCLGHDSSN